MLNAFTIDFEDWYQGIGVPAENWSNFEKRLHIGHNKILEILDKFNIKATYFLLGKTIEDHPEKVKEIIDAGHEIGCHGYSHTELFLLDRPTILNEIITCIKLIEPFNIKYTGFRAPYFSIDNRNLWVLDLIKDAGFMYDASIYPGDNKRSGITNFPHAAHFLKNDLFEIPVSTLKVMKYDMGLGGAYFRILPYSFFRRKFYKLQKNAPQIFYLHPWELDPYHPYISSLSNRRRVPHYWNLDKTEQRLEKLFRDFRFAPLKDIYHDQLNMNLSNRKKAS